MPRGEEIQHPGAGTFYVYGSGRGSSPSGSGRSRSKLGSKERISKKERGRDGSPFPIGLPMTKWDDLIKYQYHEDPTVAPNPDSLLKHGITEYTFIPISSGGVLGKGKFSTVYKVLGIDGSYYALKHTPLYPHHPLISARLLREPTLLAELPSHPCLIGVEGWVRTQGHFYLIEQYASSHVPLPAHPLPLQPSRAAYILDQLVSVIRDTLHEKGRVCHRDLKGDNVLVDVETGEILILDLGLATRFSASEPKLTTCCGSPAFHSPEIVHALSRPPGEITYYGPELDIWCIALTLLSLLLQVRFPLGPKHTSTYVMRERVRDRLQELDEMYPRHSPWKPPRSSRINDFSGSGSANSNVVNLEFERKEWRRVRNAMRDFLELDGKKRMSNFNAYTLGEQINQRVNNWIQDEKTRFSSSTRFKSTSFIETEIKYTLPIYLDQSEEEDNDDQAEHDYREAESSHRILGHGGNDKSRPKRNNHKTQTQNQNQNVITLRNPQGESERRCKSYIKYLLRSSGVLYHLLPPPSSSSSIMNGSASSTASSNGNETITTSKEDTILQLVLDMPDTPIDSSSHHQHTHAPNDPQTGWFPSFFNFHRKTPTPSTSPQQRSVSLPPSKRSEKPLTPPISPNKDTTSKSNKKVLRCYIKLEFVNQISPSISTDKRRGSLETIQTYKDGWGNTLTPLHPVTTNMSTQTNTSSSTQNQPQINSDGTARKNYIYPVRSSSVTRPVNNNNRPANRRSVSHAAALSITRPSFNRVTTMSNINVPPLSPLSRQVSLASSPSPPPTPMEPLSRAQSRASSKSRRSTSGLVPSQHHHHHQHSHGYGSSQHESKIIIHLSDPRSFQTLKKAFNVNPFPYKMNNNHSSSTEHDDLLLLSPMTIRRNSLAPSLIVSPTDEQNDQIPDPEGKIKVGITGELNPDKIIIQEHDLEQVEVNGNRNNEEEEEEEEELRGRPRSKEDISTLTNHLHKTKSRQSTNSSSNKTKSTNSIKSKSSKSRLEVKSVDSPQQLPQEKRGLLDVIFGTTSVGTNNNSNNSNNNSRNQEELGYQYHNSLGIALGSGSGYGRAMNMNIRAKSVPPFRGIEERL
ncbi:uncharacterized protein IL334_004645 [Kwoniella shivajii]|uniref:mitogen-activated protein kinase kinase n=1 Tax=Kwoniella shivajii TaxID=564305 RepID=A0ABZ1D0X7_9TREE|nr:hypothetical protein IL334_004645 [Kwoniella shivajii]